MTFEEWAQTKDFWKSSTRDAMERVWQIYAEAGVEGSIIAEALDMTMAAMSDEYGD